MLFHVLVLLTFVLPTKARHVESRGSFGDVSVETFLLPLSVADGFFAVAKFLPCCRDACSPET